MENCMSGCWEEDGIAGGEEDGVVRRAWGLPLETDVDV